MNQTHGSGRATDSIQQRISDYSFRFSFEALPPEVIEAAKGLIVDTLGGLVDGFHFEPCRISRKLAAAQGGAEGATVIGSKIRAAMDMAAFANATTARYLEANDVYARFKQGNFHGHPSDVILPILAVAEHTHSSGRDFIAAVVLGYEIYLQLCDVFRNDGFDTTIYGCASIAAAAAKLLKLGPEQLSHAVSMAVVPNNILRQVRQSHITMWNAVAAGYIGRAGVFSAMMAEAGMDGPHLPFEGKAGWCNHVAREKFTLGAMGGEEGQPYLILGARIKPRPVCAYAVPSAQAAEKVGPALKDIKAVQEITAEVFRGAWRMAEDHHWHPDSRETADHSIPYSVAVALLDSAVTTQSFDDAHLNNPDLRSLISKVKVVENEAFTKAFEARPQQYRARITVVTTDGEKLVGESGGDDDDLAAPKSRQQVADKFHGHTDRLLGNDRSNAILDRLWRLDEMTNVAEIPGLLVLE